MGVAYDVVFTCDGCGREHVVRPVTQLGRTPSKHQSTPPGWVYVKCRDHTHRYAEPPKHLAYLVACPACEPDARAFGGQRKAWDAQRHSSARKFLETLVRPIAELMGLWEKENPPPPPCWPKAAARLVHSG